METPVSPRHKVRFHSGSVDGEPVRQSNPRRAVGKQGLWINPSPWNPNTTKTHKSNYIPMLKNETAGYGYKYTENLLGNPKPWSPYTKTRLESPKASMDLENPYPKPRKYPLEENLWSRKNPRAWNTHMIKAPPTDYVPLLKAPFPRDEFTSMPLEVGFPKFYDGRFAGETSIEEEDPAIGTVDGRPMVFKSRHVDNIPKLKQYSEETKGKSYAPLHLGNDPSAGLFQRALDTSYKMKSTREEAANTSMSTSRKSDLSSNLEFSKSEVGADDASLKSGRLVLTTEWDSKNFPTEEVANLLKCRGKATFYPKTTSKVYDVNFHGRTEFPKRS